MESEAWDPFNIENYFYIFRFPVLENEVYFKKLEVNYNWLGRTNIFFLIATEYKNADSISRE